MALVLHVCVPSPPPPHGDMSRCSRPCPTPLESPMSPCPWCHHQAVTPPVTTSLWWPFARVPTSPIPMSSAVAVVLCPRIPTLPMSQWIFPDVPTSPWWPPSSILVSPCHQSLSAAGLRIQQHLPCPQHVPGLSLGGTMPEQHRAVSRPCPRPCPQLCSWDQRGHSHSRVLRWPGGTDGGCDGTQGVTRTLGAWRDTG